MIKDHKIRENFAQANCGFFLWTTDLFRVKSHGWLNSYIERYPNVLINMSASRVLGKATWPVPSKMSLRASDGEPWSTGPGSLICPNVSLDFAIPREVLESFVQFQRKGEPSWHMVTGSKKFQVFQVSFSFSQCGSILSSTSLEFSGERGRAALRLSIFSTTFSHPFVFGYWNSLQSTYDNAT